MSNTEFEFKLIFEGTEDSSVRTLQRVKGAFIADLEFPVNDVQHILQNAPLEIYKSPSEESAIHYYETLKAAGAKVLLVRPSAAHAQAAGEELVIDFADPGEERKTEQVPVTNKVYTLDVDDVLFGTTDSEETTLPETAKTADTAVQNTDLSLQLGEVDNDDGALFPDVAPATPPTPTLNLPGDLFLLDEFEKEESELKRLDSSLPTAGSEIAFEAAATAAIAAGTSPQSAAIPAATSTTLDDSFSLSLEGEEAVVPAPSAPATPPPLDTVAKSAHPSPSLGDSLNLSLSDTPEVDQLLDSVVDKHTEAVEFDLNIASEEPPPQKAPKVDAAPVADAPLESAPPSGAAKASKAPPPSIDIEAFSIPDLSGSDDDVPLAELQSKMQEINQIASAEKKAPPKQSANKEYLIAFALCAVLLIGGNFIRSLLSSDDSTEGRFQFNPELSASMGGSSHKAEQIPVVESQITASDEVAGKKVSLALTMQNQAGVLVGVRGPVTFEFPPQPELTPQEIVHGTIRPPWLRKAEASTFEILPSSEKQIRILGPTKLYIDYDGAKIRAVGRVQIEFTELAESTTVHYRVMLFNELESDKITAEVPVSRTREGTFSFAFIFEGDAQRVLKKADAVKEKAGGAKDKVDSKEKKEQP